MGRILKVNPLSVSPNRDGRTKNQPVLRRFRASGLWLGLMARRVCAVKPTAERRKRLNRTSFGSLDIHDSWQQ